MGVRARALIPQFVLKSQQYVRTLPTPAVPVCHALTLRRAAFATSTRARRIRAGLTSTHVAAEQLVLQRLTAKAMVRARALIPQFVLKSQQYVRTLPTPAVPV